MQKSNPFERVHATATKPEELEALAEAQREARVRGIVDTAVALLVMVGVPSALVVGIVFAMRFIR